MNRWAKRSERLGDQFDFTSGQNTVMRNAVELTERWSQLTGEPLKETRQRVRVLRLSGLLPDARIERDPLNDEQVAKFILASLASETQAGAPDAAQNYTELLPAGSPSPELFAGKTLLDAVVELIRQARHSGPWMLMELRTTSTIPEAELVLLDPEGALTHLHYAGQPLPAQPPIKVTRTLAGRVLSALVRGEIPQPSTKRMP